MTPGRECDDCNGAFPIAPGGVVAYERNADNKPVSARAETTSRRRPFSLRE